MSSVSSVNPGVADLLQTLSRVNSPVLSSQTVVSALEKASTSDIVQLSSQAIQLEGVDAMFGLSNSSSDMTSALTSLENAGGSTPSVLANASTADQLANYRSELSAQMSEGLFGTGNVGNLTGSLFSTIG